VVIDLDDIRTRYQQACKFLDERGRRLFGANEALALGHGGVTATSTATGLARSTIRRAIVELQSGANPIGPRVRRKGGGRKRAVTLQPELPGALETLIEDAIRGDPETPLRWVSRSQRQIARVLGDCASPSARSWWACCCANWATAAKPTARPGKGRTIPIAMPSSSTSTPSCKRR